MSTGRGSRPDRRRVGDLPRRVRRPIPPPAQRPIPRSLARGTVAIAGTYLGLRLGSRTAGPVGPLDVTADIGLHPHGGVVADVPPLGRAHLRTHAGPLRVTVTASGVQPSRAEGLLHMPTDDADAADVKDQLARATTTLAADARTLGRMLAARTAAAGVVGTGLLAALTLRRPRDVLTATVISAGGLAAATAAAALTADRDAWRHPELTGLLEHAPLILGDLQQAPDNIARYRDQLADLLRTGTAVYRRVAELPEPPPADAIRLVHISDIHLSPLALPLAKALVDEYRADAVIDTGDLVDWGTPAEAALAAQIPSLGVPYVYVKGNHDSTGIAAAVARQPNAVVLDAAGPPRHVAGLDFAGMADPRFTPDKTTGDDHAYHRVGEAAKDFATHLRDTGADVDIALVHAPAAGRALAGLVPLVLAGDIHRRDVRRFGDTTVLVQGSTGGSGLRGVQQDPPTPVMLSVLYVDRTTRRLWGTDEVTLDGLGSTGLQITRRTLAQLQDGA